MSDKYLRNEQQQLLNSIGTEVCWGWSPAVDFASVLAKRPRCTAKGKETHAKKATDATDVLRVTPTYANGSSAAKTKEELGFEALLAQARSRKAEASAPLRQAPSARTSATKAPSGVDDGGATTSGSDTDSEVHLLLAGACDIRHILRTLSSLRATEGLAEESAATTIPASPTYHFYLYEPNLRLHCRHLFFLQWLLDSMFALEELEERVLMFLDVYGNAVMREITAAQVRNVVQRLRKALETDSSALQRIVSFEEMKHKERDFVEGQLLHWSRDASVVDIEAQWMQRVRQEMAERYDNRDNIIDWDFVFHLTEYTNLLKFPEYRTWRNTGVAFDTGHINPRRNFTYNYTVPNKTLCFFSRTGRGTYAGDIKNGPFFTFGALTDNAYIRHRTTDGTCKYGNGVVSLHNVRAWLYTLMTGLPWPWADHVFAWDDAKNYNYLPPGTPSGVSYAASLPKVRVHLLGLDWDRFVLHCIEGKAPRMDAAFFGTSCTQCMTKDVLQRVLRAETGVVVTETAKFIVDAEDVAKDAYVAKLETLAKSAGWAREETLTQLLHEGTPEPRPVKGAVSEAQKAAERRYAQPALLAFTYTAEQMRME
jgi:dynein assembly factor 3, axonemal